MKRLLNQEINSDNGSKIREFES